MGDDTNTTSATPLPDLGSVVSQLNAVSDKTGLTFSALPNGNGVQAKLSSDQIDHLKVDERVAGAPTITDVAGAKFTFGEEQQTKKKLLGGGFLKVAEGALESRVPVVGGEISKLEGGATPKHPVVVGTGLTQEDVNTFVKRAASTGDLLKGDPVSAKKDLDAAMKTSDVTFPKNITLEPVETAMAQPNTSGQQRPKATGLTPAA